MTSHHMQRRRAGTLAASLALALLGSGSASHAAKLGPVSVGVPRQPSPTGDLRISFLPRYLPRGGYYYAVLVLENYRDHVLGAPPTCAVSSDMDKTEYGYPTRGHRLRLTVIPARSQTDRWCIGGIYQGALYAVPHRPPCSKRYPCYGKRTCGGIPVCGVVPYPAPAPYSYPGGLPPPLDRSTRIVGRFQVSF
jgi:hypothetical protein